ncbi:MAG TPA: cytochrome c [Blastocatellia bacterium]|nr:cytochrome c [Blastocatellia bacterium]
MNIGKNIKASTIVLSLLVGVLFLMGQSGPSVFGTASATSSPLRVQDGNALYIARCAGCHGKDGCGLAMWKSKGQPDLCSGEYQTSRTDAQIHDSIANGKGKFMPAFKGKLSEAELQALVKQVRAFRKKG